MQTEEKIKEKVRQRYTRAVTGGGSCCGSSQELVQIRIPDKRVASVAGYEPEELRTLPADAVANSFGCGNPLAFAGVKEGETVVDIGSGAGIDCLLAAEKVGPKGKVIGIDMTPAMLEKARANAQRSGAQNVEFRFGYAEEMPVEDSSADWIISNCVINLSPNKPGVFAEAARVLRPGGKLSVSDIIVEKLPWFLRRSTALYTSCVSGAIPESEYLQGLRNAGLQNVNVTSRIVYDRDQILSFLQDSAMFRAAYRLFPRAIAGLVDRYIVGKIWSAKIVAQKTEVKNENRLVV
jgi:SAM-dependent methyltransferase